MVLDHLLVPLLPLTGSLITGLFGGLLSKKNSHRLAIFLLLISTILSFKIFFEVLEKGPYEYSLFEWANIANIKFEIGFLIDKLTASMMVVVTFVSLMVHIYTIGYMKDEKGYKRFFSYISLFTFSMLMLVMSNNLLQLFFGWEAVGLVSYLLIGFYYEKDTAIYANLKAFLVNRVGDLGFLLGIGLIIIYTGTLNYKEIFDLLPSLLDINYSIFNDFSFYLLTIICICLFIGAMGKSAQFPLHIWLPDSMEGPTPISALIHAATMVTAGIFMVSRLSPIFELSETALIFIMIIGSITALFMGVLGMIQNDIKRIVAYSTLSQLGYMTVALGASAYSLAIFHLVTHAFFKALLFLSAGSVIIGMHHEQDIRKMGGLYKFMPITWLLTLIGSLSLAGVPFFAGFYSKDLIIESIKYSDIWISNYIYWVLNIGVFITSFYSFRLLFLVFHGKPNFDVTHHPPKESEWVVLVPLIFLAIPSVFLGAFIFDPLFLSNFFENIIYVLPSNDKTSEIKLIAENAIDFGLHGFLTKPFFFIVLGFLSALIFCNLFPKLSHFFTTKVPFFMNILREKYYCDKLNEIVFIRGSTFLGKKLYEISEKSVIDGFLVHGTVRIAQKFGQVMKSFQSGFLFHYAIIMIASVILFIWWIIPQPNIT